MLKCISKSVWSFIFLQISYFYIQVVFLCRWCIYFPELSPLRLGWNYWTSNYPIICQTGHQTSTSSAFVELLETFSRIQMNSTKNQTDYITCTVNCENVQILTAIHANVPETDFSCTDHCFGVCRCFVFLKKKKNSWSTHETMKPKTLLWLHCFMSIEGKNGRST